MDEIEGIQEIEEIEGKEAIEGIEHETNYTLPK